MTVWNYFNPLHLKDSYVHSQISNLVEGKCYSLAKHVKTMSRAYITSVSFFFFCYFEKEADSIFI